MNVQTTTFAYAWTTSSPSNEAANASQVVKLNHSPAQSYVLSGWAMANAVPDNLNSAEDSAQDTKKQFGLRAVITYSDNTKEYHYVPFDPDIKTWQFTSMTIVPEKVNEDVTVSTITVVCAYEGNANAAYFDDLSLVCASAQSYYTYDCHDCHRGRFYVLTKRTLCNTIAWVMRHAETG